MDGEGHPAGFTLVELLVAMALTAVIGGAVVALILRQNRFYAQHGEYVFAAQTVRAAGDLAAAELRMAGPGDLVAAAADSVTVRYDVSRAVVCSSSDAFGTTSVFVFDSATNANISGTGSGTAVSGPYETDHTYADGWGPSVTTGVGSKTICVDRGAPDVSESWRYRRYDGWNAGPFGEPPVRGSVVRGYRYLTYRFAASSFGSGTALWRNSQELVAPFDTGAAFSYVMANGDTASAPGTLPDVRGIRIAATASGAEDARVEGSRDMDVIVWLQNER